MYTADSTDHHSMSWPQQLRQQAFRGAPRSASYTLQCRPLGCMYKRCTKQVTQTGSFTINSLRAQYQMAHTTANSMRCHAKRCCNLRLIRTNCTRGVLPSPNTLATIAAFLRRTLRLITCMCTPSYTWTNQNKEARAPPT